MIYILAKIFIKYLPHKDLLKIKNKEDKVYNAPSITPDT